MMTREPAESRGFRGNVRSRMDHRIVFTSRAVALLPRFRVIEKESAESERGTGNCVGLPFVSSKT